MAKKKAARRPTPRRRAAASRAKRKLPRPARRRTTVRASGRAAKARASSRRIKKTPAGRRATKAATRKVARKAARKAAKKVARKAASSAATKKTSTKTAAKVSTPRNASNKPSPPVAGKTAAQSRKAAVAPKPRVTQPVREAPARQQPGRPPRPQRGPAPGLNRERRTLVGDDVSSPPSSFGFEPRASSAHSGGRELHEKLVNHPGDTGPGITGGDVDGDWESAYSVGDEAPGGDNPTPDQDLVDEIGRAVGVQYEDDEELEGEHKISERDRHRWEYDPASSDDWGERED